MFFLTLDMHLCMNIYDLKTISIKLFMDVVFENNCENKKMGIEKS